MGSASHLQDPGSVSAEDVSGVDEVAVSGEAGQHVLETLLERVDLRVDQDLGHDVLRGELDQTLACRRSARVRGCGLAGG